MTRPTPDCIRIRGARQNNLRSLDLDLPLRELVVVTGVSGSGKSSLVFDTVYAEGQRRYVETFSPYARQFLDRMDKPRVDRIDGIPPAIAIDQTNPVRTSRSTVGTMTELNDHLKLLYARAAQLHCRNCGAPVRRDTAQSIADDVPARARALTDPRLIVTFPVEVPDNFSEAEVLDLLARQGYTRVHARRGRVLEIVQDRLRLGGAERARLVDTLESALKLGRGRICVHAQTDPPQDWRYSSDLHCPDCDIAYRDPTPSLFSFNSPLGACDTCRGFGRVIGVDYGLVIPDGSKTLRGGAVRPWQTDAYRECQDDLLKYARKRGVPVDVPWRELTDEQRRWVIEGEGPWEKKVWYGVRRFFAWLEGRAYKMHIRVLLSRYRSYTACGDCGGARLKPEALLWRLGSPGLNVHELMLLPIERCLEFFAGLVLPAQLDEAADLLLGEVRSRLEFLVRVGLGYLTLDRQSRTLSGGEVQRINLTTALGTSLVNTLFVLDEPSIGLHPRDMRRVIEVMQRLKQNGNSLLVVEHDPQIMLAADRILDLGPGPGERGGRVVFDGTPAEIVAKRHAHGRLSRGAPRRGCRAQPARRAGARDTAPAARGRLAAQSSGSRRRVSAQPAGMRHRRVGLGQVDLGARRAVRGAASAPRASRPRRRARTGDSSAPSTSAGSYWWTRRRSGGRPGRIPRATSAPSTRSASDSRPRPRRSSAAIPSARSASTPATGAVRPAAVTASSTSRCSSSPTCICAVRTATVGVIGPRSSKRRSRATKVRRAASPTCSR